MKVCAAPSPQRRPRGQVFVRGVLAFVLAASGTLTTGLRRWGDPGSETANLDRRVPEFRVLGSPTRTHCREIRSCGARFRLRVSDLGLRMRIC